MQLVSPTDLFHDWKTHLPHHVACIGLGQVFEVHNGKTFHKLLVTEDMVGHKLGEFSPTRTFKGHSGRKKDLRR